MKGRPDAPLIRQAAGASGKSREGRDSRPRDVAPNLICQRANQPSSTIGRAWYHRRGKSQWLFCGYFWHTPTTGCVVYLSGKRKAESLDSLYVVCRPVLSSTILWVFLTHSRRGLRDTVAKDYCKQCKSVAGQRLMQCLQKTIASTAKVFGTWHSCSGCNSLLQQYHSALVNQSEKSQSRRITTLFNRYVAF